MRIIANSAECVELFIKLTEPQQDTIEFLRQVDSMVNKDQYLSDFCLSIKRMVYDEHERNYFGDSVKKAYPWLEMKLGKYAGIFPLYILLLAFDQVVKRYTEMQIPLDILKNTFSDVNLEINRKKHGYPELVHYFWTPYYFLLREFRIGRLNFIAAPFDKNFAVLRNKKTFERRTILTESAEVLPSGYFNGTNGVSDANSFRAIFRLDSEGVTGNLVDTDLGIITSEGITLSFDEWEPVLLPSDPILQVHIPPDGKLNIEECEKALKDGISFYRKYFPEYEFKAFTCISWLIDTKLREFLPADSNTVRFMSMYERFPVYSSKPNIFSWIFDCDFKHEDVLNMPLKTSMQKRLVEYLKVGGKVYTGGGYILREKYDEDVSDYLISHTDVFP